MNETRVQSKKSIPWLIMGLLFLFLVGLVLVTVLVIVPRFNDNKTSISMNENKHGNKIQENIGGFRYLSGPFGFGDVYIGLIGSYCILDSLGLSLENWEWYLPAWYQDFFEPQILYTPFDYQTDKHVLENKQVQHWDLCNLPKLKEIRSKGLQNKTWSQWIADQRPTLTKRPVQLVTNVAWYVYYLLERFPDPDYYAPDDDSFDQMLQQQTSHLFMKPLKEWALVKPNVMKIVDDLLNRNGIVVHIRSGDFYSASTDGHRVFSDESMKQYIQQVTDKVIAKHPSEAQRGIYVAADSEWALSRVPETWHRWDQTKDLPSHSSSELARDQVNHLRTIVEFLLFFYAPVVVVCGNSNFSQVGAIANIKASRYVYREYEQELRSVQFSRELFEKK